MVLEAPEDLRVWSALQDGRQNNIRRQFFAKENEMKINGNQIKPGNVLEHNGTLWVVVKTDHVKPGKGGAFAQVEMKNLINGSKLNERFRATESVEKVRLEQKDFQFLYEQGEELVFMDDETYEQLSNCRRTLSASALPSCRTA